MVGLAQSLPRARIVCLELNYSLILTDMISMNNDDTLIAKLISETYDSEADDKDLPNSFVDLRNYFEKRLNQVDFLSLSDYIGQNQLSAVEFIFQSNSMCYRLIMKDSILDFPSNWSIFKEIKSQDLIYVDQSLDQDFLLDIFAELNGEYGNIALLKEGSVLKMVFLPEHDSKEHIQWMRSYFEKKNQVSEKEAA